MRLGVGRMSEEGEGIKKHRVPVINTAVEMPSTAQGIWSITL